MANKTIDMRQIRQILRLYTTGVSKLKISQQLGLSRNTVKKYINLFERNRLTYEELSELTDEELEDLFENKLNLLTSESNQAASLDYSYLSKELKKVGVTRYLLWQEYKINHPEGICYSRFCQLYKRWSKQVNPSMHIEHKAGDKMFVDYTGKKLSLTDKTTGELQEVEVFISVLGASGMTYVEATRTQRKEDFLGSLSKSLHYYGGVPRAIVTDNLKTAVKKSDNYEPIITDSLLDFASHYSCTILPTRTYHPKDKALVENAVKIVYTKIFAPLRNEHFSTLEELNNAILDLLIHYNSSLLTGRRYSRSDKFNEIEKPALFALPVLAYQFKQYAQATVSKTSHIYLNKDKHYYSVPFTYISKKVVVLYSKSIVEVYYKQKRIALHNRSHSKYTYTTVKEHMPSTHQFQSEWNPSRFLNWGESIGEYCRGYILRVLEKKQHPEQSYKTCMGILSLAKKVGNQRLENACKRALGSEQYTYTMIKNILERGFDRLEDQDPETEEKQIPEHDNIRGKEYYK